MNSYEKSLRIIDTLRNTSRHSLGREHPRNSSKNALRNSFRKSPMSSSRNFPSNAGALLRITPGTFYQFHQKTIQKFVQDTLWGLFHESFQRLIQETIIFFFWKPPRRVSLGYATRKLSAKLLQEQSKASTITPTTEAPLGTLGHEFLQDLFWELLQKPTADFLQEQPFRELSQNSPDNPLEAPPENYQRVPTVNPPQVPLATPPVLLEQLYNCYRNCSIQYLVKKFF